MLAIGVALVFTVGLLAGSASAYLAIKTRTDNLQAQLTNDLQAGQRELEAGKASLEAANAKRDVSAVSEATTHFANAKRHFQAASQGADNSRLLRYMEDVPAI